MAPPQKSVTAIVAATVNNGIGLNGTLPWRLPGELKFFAQVTTGESLPPNQHNVTIMGRKTWEGIPPKFRPLKSRYNIVISRQGIDLSGKPKTSSHSSLASALANLPTNINRVFLIGGAQLYNPALTSDPPMVDRVLLTRVLTPYECDTFLTDFTRDKAWTQASHKELCGWVGWDVPEGEIEGKGGKYRFEMWTWRKS